jgi:predicted Rossmann fold nucleotide-binding protein DprA/Smf involved in DNA uptake
MMSAEGVSADTEAVLLLCGRFGGEGRAPSEPLSTPEYAALARWLNQRGLRPADLLTAEGRAALGNAQEVGLATERIGFLLERGTAMALSLERWSRAGLWVLSRADDAYPRALKRGMKHDAPPLLYGAGRQALLDVGGQAVSVLAGDLLKASVGRLNRSGLQQGRLALVSPFAPEVGVHPDNAIVRDRCINALADRS